jgi:hypothetical protein
MCCASGEVCVDDGTEKTCAQPCSDSSSCPAESPCCTLLPGGMSGCLPNNVNATQQCLCTTSSECTSGACAPATDASGNPVGPYVCKANDGGGYDGCHGVFTTCAGNYCCVEDTNSNEFCSIECTTDLDCGSAHCNPYSFSVSSCSGPNACGP